MENPITTGATPAPENIQPTAGTPNPFKKVILALVSLLVVGGVGATVYLNMGTPAQGDPNEPPPSLSVGGGGIKGSFTGESTQGFLQYEAKDITDFDSTKAALVAKFGTPGVVKGNALTNYMSVNADGMTMADVVNNYNPKAVGNRALFIMYSAGQGGLSKGFHTYPAGPFGTATTEIKKDDLSKVPLARNSGVVILSRSDTEIYGVLDPATAPSGSYTGPFLPDDKGGWVLVSGNGKLSDLIGASKDRIISAWTLKDATTFEKVDMNTFSFSTYHMAWLNLSPTAIAPKITKVEPATAVQGQKAVTFTVTGTDLGGAQVSFIPPADFQNVTGLVVDTTKTSVKFVADIADAATADLKEIKVTTTAGSVSDKSFKVTAKEVVNPLIGQTVLAHYNFPGTLATVQWFEAKVTAVKNNKFSYTFVNKIVGPARDGSFDIDPKVTPGASISDDYETNIAVPADAPYLEGEKDLYVIVKYKTTGGYWNATLDSKNADGTYNITYLNDKNTDKVPLAKIYKPLGEKTHIAPVVVTNKAEVPTIKTLSVKEGVSGELVKLDITGTNLDTVTMLSLGGLESGTPITQTPTAAHFEFFVNTNLAVGDRNLVVINPAGPSASSTFTVKNKSLFLPLIPKLIVKTDLSPTISTLSVKEGISGELINLTITGTNLDTVTMLKLGGLESGTPLSTEPTKASFGFFINTNVPVGEQDLEIVNPAGSTRAKFTVKAASTTGIKDKGATSTAPRQMTFTLPTNSGTVDLATAKQYGLLFAANSTNTISHLKDDKGNFYLNYKFTLTKGDAIVWASGWTDTFPQPFLWSPACVVNVITLERGNPKADVWTCPSGTIPAAALKDITAGSYTLTGEIGDGEKSSAPKSVTFKIEEPAKVEVTPAAPVETGTNALYGVDVLGKKADGFQWFKGKISNKDIKTFKTWLGDLPVEDVTYEDGSVEPNLLPSLVANLNVHPASVEVNQKIIIESTVGPGTYWNATVKSTSGNSVTATYDDEVKDVTQTLDHVWTSLAGKEMKDVAAATTALTDVEADLANLKVIVNNPQVNLTTGDVDGITFWINGSGLKSTEYGSGGKKLDFNLTRNGTQVLPVLIDPPTTNPQSFQYLDAIYVRNAGGSICTRWKTSGDSTCSVSTTNIPFLPAELSTTPLWNGSYAIKTQFLKIPYLETKKAQNYVFTFTLDGKTVYTQNYTYQRGEPDFKISGFTPSIMKYDAAIKGYVSSAPKDEFGWAKTCNTNYTTKVETCYQETYDMPNTFYEQRVKITNNSETGFVLPYQLADYTIRLYAPGANPDDKASAIMTLPAADIATYTSPGTNLPGPKQTVILRIPYDKLKSTAGIVKLWHKVGGEEVISGSGN